MPTVAGLFHKFYKQPKMRLARRRFVQKNLRETKRTRTPFIFSPGNGQFQPAVLKSLLNFRKFRRQNPGHDQSAAAFHLRRDFLFFRDQQVGNQIRAHQIELLLRFRRQFRHVVALDLQFSLDAVHPRIGLCDADGRRVKIKRAHRLKTEFCRRDGQDSRAGADVQKSRGAHAPSRVLADASSDSVRCAAHRTAPEAGALPGFEAHKFAGAKRSRRMPAGAKTQAGIENDNRLAFARTFLAPARLDQQCSADFNRFEMLFPRFRPVLAFYFRDFNFSGANLKSIIFDLLQSASDFATNFFREWLVAENTDAADAGFKIEASCGCFAGQRGKQFSDGILGFLRSRDGNFPKLFRLHATKSRHGVKFSSSISAMCGCSATCVMLAYSMSKWFVLGSGSLSKMASIMRMTPPWQNTATFCPR